MPTDDKAVPDAKKTAISYAFDWGGESSPPFLPPPPSPPLFSVLPSTSLLTTRTHRITTPPDATRDTARRPLRTALPPATHALPTHPALQRVPEPQCLHRRRRGPDGRVVRPVSAGGAAHEAACRAEVWRQGRDARGCYGACWCECRRLWDYLCVGAEKRGG